MKIIGPTKRLHVYYTCILVFVHANVRNLYGPALRRIRLELATSGDDLRASYWGISSRDSPPVASARNILNHKPLEFLLYHQSTLPGGFVIQNPLSLVLLILLAQPSSTSKIECLWVSAPSTTRKKKSGYALRYHMYAFFGHVIEARGAVQ